MQARPWDRRLSSANGTYFVNGHFYISAYDDPYNLDADNDGIACELGEGGWGNWRSEQTLRDDF